MDTTIHNPMDPPQPTIRPNLIDGITINRQIGSGATSIVYLGVENENPETRYAVKLLSPFLCMQDSALKRWEREARLLTSLKHPNVVEGIRSGIAEGRPYLIMEFLQGESLMDRVRRLGKIQEEEVIHIAHSTLLALQAAHDRNIIHRDIKPANMIRLNDGTIKVMDFGLARALDEYTITATGMVVGTPIYVSPEMAAGDENIDIQSDLYSLGITLFHLVAGAPPFATLNTSLLLTKKITDEVPDVRTVDKEISGETAYLLFRLCARNRELRLKTPREAIELIEQLKAGKVSTTGMGSTTQTSVSRAVKVDLDQIDSSHSILKAIVSNESLPTTPNFLSSNEVLFYEDDESRECYLLMSGKVEILKSGRAIAEIYEPGSFIGEMSPLTGSPRTATVVAREETVLLKIEEQDFKEFFSHHPEMGILLAQSLANRLEKTNNKLDEANTRLGLINHHLKEINSVMTGIVKR